MPKKIPRDICLIKYRKFPLWEIEEETEEDISYYPEIVSHYWLKLEYKTDKNLKKNLSSELNKLYEYLEIDDLIFFSAHNMNWISKYTAKRDDSKALTKAVDYFKKHKLSGKFNGAIKINMMELKEFIKHFFELTQCDSGFFHNHFMNKEQEILGYIHYSGEVRFDTLNEKMDRKFLKIIGKTNFLDSFNENTNRI